MEATPLRAGTMPSQRRASAMGVRVIGASGKYRDRTGDLRLAKLDDFLPAMGVEPGRTGKAAPSSRPSGGWVEDDLHSPVLLGEVDCLGRFLESHSVRDD